MQVSSNVILSAGEVAAVVAAKFNCSVTENANGEYVLSGDAASVNKVVRCLKPKKTTEVE